MARYVQVVELDRLSCTLEGLDELVEEVREVALPEVLEEAGSPGRITALKITVEAEDQWELRDLLDDLESKLADRSELLGRFSIDRKYLVEE